MGAMTVAFWSRAEHHAIATRPVYNKMKRLGMDVVDLFNKPARELALHSCIVTSTAANIPPSKRKNTIFHFHSLSPYHISPKEAEYKYIPLFKGVMFPGEWWADKWPEKPEHWAVVGWPKNDIRKPSTKRKRTVLYAVSMHDFGRMRNLTLLTALSRELGFRLIVKPHHGIAMWYPAHLEAMKKLAHLEESTHDISAYFRAADVLVSETSGSLWEFMATNRPSVQINQNMSWVRLYPGGVLEATYETLEEAVKKALEDPGVTSSEIALWREKVMGPLDGKAIDRAITFIQETFGQ